MTLTRRFPSLKRGARPRGFSLIELMIGMSVVAVAAMAGVAYVGRASQSADHARDRLFARQKALSILQELRAYVEGGDGQVAADLDGFDDGLAQNATLSIAPDPLVPTNFVAPEHPVSGNVLDRNEWRWYRRITVRHFPGVVTRDLRVCTVRVFRHRATQDIPGEPMAEVSSVIRTIGDSYPTTQVYDVYLLALENVPGWWVYMDSIKPFIDATLSDLEARNPGLSFRTHWITASGYGRDEQYAPYTNETRISTDATPWAYVYPGKMPTGLASTRYYVPETMQARVNLDGQNSPIFKNDYSTGETFTDSNGNGKHDASEAYVDANGDGDFDQGDKVPYALADQHNHAMRWPDENAKFEARVAVGLDEEEIPTWRLLLDRMIADPTKYHNAIFINLHGELLPMPAVRNYGDASKDPVGHPGWRVVAHPELLRPRRVAGSDVNSDSTRWRVYGYKSEFQSAEHLMTQKEPWTDLNLNGKWDAGEPYADWNADGRWTDETPATLEIPGIDATSAVNAATNPSLLVKRLPGGIDADGNGTADTYAAFANAATFPETFTDLNGDGRRNVAEPYFDQNGNGSYDVGEPFVEIDGVPGRSAVTEAWVDANANLRPDLTSGPSDVFTDTNGNKTWDAGEAYFDINGDKVRNGPTNPTPPAWRAWSPVIDDVSLASRAAYATDYGEPYTDANANGAYNGPEPLLYDVNGNGVFDGGYGRGEMWFQAAWDAAAKMTVLTLHATPLECPETADGRGIDTTARLYDLEYVPCPMINSALATAPAFERDLSNATVDVPKNTARWTVEVTLPTLRKAFETTVGAGNGDAKDHMIELRTRIGTDRTTGAMWPVKNKPENLSKSWSYWYGVATDVPFSERYQFQGDPRHCPYADLDRYGGSFPNGSNWYFDNFNSNGNQQAKWLAFDSSRFQAGWLGRCQSDTARLLSWVRSAITKTEAVYTTLTGFSYFYVSLGGDVGYDSANGYASSIPMDGATFGQAADVYEDTIAGGGTAGIGASQKFVRSNDGVAANGARTGGYWWSKPWIGELSQDSAYATEWNTWGNLRADATSNALTYRLLRRGDLTVAQQPLGTKLGNLMARTKEEGSTSLFNVGTSGSTFHHQYADGATGTLTGDGPQLAANYNFPLPTTAGISRPFALATAAAGGVGPEFAWTTDYPKYTAQSVVDFYNHSGGTKGSGLVRLIEPGATPRAGFIVVNGIDKTTGSGSAFIARYSLISLIHSFFAAGVSGTGRIKQLPRLQIASPTIVTELTNPSTITITWKTEWKRWDGLPYTTSYAAGFTEAESDLVYVLTYSKDGGRTWLNVKGNVAETPGTLPWIVGTGPDPARTINDAATGNESYVWATPAGSFPEGSYLLHIEGFRKAEAQHYVAHQEKIYVNR